jgi:6-phosphogluconolactonase
VSELLISPDANRLAERAAEFIVMLAEMHRPFTIALSGGSTPRALYSLLASNAYSSRINWNNVQFFWSDERCLPPDDPESNYYLARTTLFDHAPIPASNIHRVKSELPPPEAAAEYERQLRNYFSEDNWPRFDLVLLGMGDDGHTASLFPHTAALSEEKRWVVGNQVQTAKPPWRITFTRPLINAAHNVAFLVAGAGKADRLKQVLQGPLDPESLPSQSIKPSQGELYWFLDEAAASQLTLPGQP